MKRHLLQVLLINLVCASLTAQTSNYSELIAQKANAIEAKVIDWRHDIHEHPELGNREIRTAALVAKHLKSLGIETTTEVGVTGVIGILKGDQPGPVIALRADMDALPVEETNDLPFASKVKTMYNGKETSVMHACGHDGHTAILMGVAEILASMKKDLKGTVKFIFQPAEEGAPKGEEGGAKLLVEEGVLENPKVNVIFGLHLSAQTEVGKITYRPAGIMAGATDFMITVNGKPSHGSQPWLSVDPILTAAQIVTSINTIVSKNIKLTENPAVVIVAAINGGNRSNIIPGQVEMLGSIRAFSNKDETLIYERIKQIAENTAIAAGATAVVEVPYTVHYPVTFNNVELTKAALPALEKAAGPENIILIPPITGSEDFSYFAQKVPGFFFFIGGMPKGQDTKLAGPHHTPEFIIEDTAFKTGVKALCNLVLHYSHDGKN